MCLDLRAPVYWVTWHMLWLMHFVTISIQSNNTAKTFSCAVLQSSLGVYMLVSQNSVAWFSNLVFHQHFKLVSCAIHDILAYTDEVWMPHVKLVPNRTPSSKHPYAPVYDQSPQYAHWYNMCNRPNSAITAAHWLALSSYLNVSPEVQHINETPSIITLILLLTFKSIIRPLHWTFAHPIDASVQGACSIMY